MQKHDLVQGSPEWLAYRMNHHNASDAPAMLGLSPYKSRDALLLELHTGLAAEVSEETQRVFDDGHRFEALARPLAERIIGEDLYPLVASEGKLSASFDGLTMLEDVAFEHKSLNNELRTVMVEGITGADLPLHYQVQMEQQCLIAGCERVLFMASKWDADGALVEERHCWYEPNPELRARIVAGWAQFEQDLCEFVPPERTALVVAAPVTALPSVSVQVSGAIALRDNFGAFEVAVRDFIEHKLIREPKTDQDFADLDLQIKAMKGAEEALDAAESQMLAQITTVDAAKRTKDMLHKLVRDNRLMAEKLLASEKERRKAEIVREAGDALKAHIEALTARIGKPYMPAVAADFAGAIKGKKSIDSMQSALNQVLVNAKLDANATADRIHANLTTLRELAADFAFLFNDTAAIVLKAPEDLTALVKSRIADHKAAEAERIEREKARLQAEIDRKNEAERLARQRQADEFAARVTARFAEFDRLLTFTEQTSSATINAALLLASSNAPSVDTFGDRLEEAQKRHALVLEHLQAALPGALRREEAEETARLAAEAEALAARQAAEAAAAARAAIVPVAEPVSQVRQPTATLVEEPTLRIGDINAAIKPFSIDAAGMASLGLHGTKRGAAMLFKRSDLIRLTDLGADLLLTAGTAVSLEKAA